ncbi:MAG TPA: tyrosine--tRNA ligase [Chloroflexota bacterium]|nr:tyrosine--tRNA ligase [Chloroflexota bacterium]HZU05938.1 tyrosine--tRNA ligase [Chloroflexota bacterium]
MNAFDVLVERGYVKDVSDAAGLRAALERPITFYCGFDPTASSLHVGSLVPVMAMAQLQRHGHRPIVVVGGGTAMVGDPSGKTATRPVLAPEQIRANAAAIREQLARYFTFDEGRALIVDNAEWLLPLRYIDFLREIGRHFNVNQMLHAETYRTRLSSEAGLNFVEFNYMLLQAYDFLHLYQTYGCILQLGGSDQWSNILAGVDLIRKVTGGTAYALTCPLIETASGAKMGKTEAGAVWLDPARTSPYEYYQFWINTEDPDVERFLALFTFLPMDEVRALGRLQGADLRRAKERLAFEATRLTHGEAAAREAQEASRALFGGDGRERGAEPAFAAAAVPTTVLPAAELEAGVEAVELFVRAGLCSSRGEARRLIAQSGAYVNQRRVERPDERFTTRDLVDGALLLRKGKKHYHRIAVA